MQLSFLFSVIQNLPPGYWLQMQLGYGFVGTFSLTMEGF